MKILDMSAGNRAMWFDKNNPLVTFLDIRPEMHPMIVCDTRHMPDSVGNDYDLIVFDPPHTTFGPNAAMAKTYGSHKAAEVREIVSESSKEAHRVSRPGALMAFKWNDHAQKLEKILALMEPYWEPLFGQKVALRTKHASGTYWAVLRRKDL